jgi:hypothetical protein
MLQILMLMAEAMVVQAPGAVPRPTETRNCADHASKEIVVCKSRTDPDHYRLPLPAPSSTGPRQAEFGLFGSVTGKVYGIQRKIAPGVSAPAAMVTITVPF